jgi:hypothetical protein
VFASVVNWYRTAGWDVQLIHPKKAKTGETTAVRLKFSTRGRPDNYTRAICTRGEQRLQVRHGLRVATRAFRSSSPLGRSANVCLDVAVIDDQDLARFSTNHAVDNETLVTFGEAKHMSAFAELIAGFLGLVSEMMPEHLGSTRPYIGPLRVRPHPAPFLFVSGFLYPTAQGMLDTILYRGLDIDILDHETTMFGLVLPRRFVTASPRPRFVVPADKVPF